MGKLARMDVSLSTDGNTEENSEKKREMEAQDYSNKSLAYGFKTRSIYGTAMEKMKDKCKYPCELTLNVVSHLIVL